MCLRVRTTSVNNNQLFLFVAAFLAKVSFACLCSLGAFLSVCVFAIAQRTFKLGIEVFEGETKSRYKNDQTGSLLQAKFSMSLVSEPA